MASGTSQSSDYGTWVVVPAYNEAGAMWRTVAAIRRTGHRVLVVDDGSRDETGRIAARAGAAVITHPVNLGQGAALQTGIAHALSCGAAYIVTFDADGQHRVDDISRLLDALTRHAADFALGSRFLGSAKGMPASRRLLLRLAAWFTRLTTNLAVTDAHNGLRAMTSRGARSIHLRQNRMAHASEILDQIAQSGLKYVEVPVTVDYTPYSLAKGQRSSEAIDILLDLYARRLHR